MFQILVLSLAAVRILNHSTLEHNHVASTYINMILVEQPSNLKKLFGHYVQSVAFRYPLFVDQLKYHLFEGLGGGFIYICSESLFATLRIVYGDRSPRG